MRSNYFSVKVVQENSVKSWGPKETKQRKPKKLHIFLPKLNANCCHLSMRWHAWRQKEAVTVAAVSLTMFFLFFFVFCQSTDARQRNVNLPKRKNKLAFKTSQVTWSHRVQQQRCAVEANKQTNNIKMSFCRLCGMGGGGRRHKNRTNKTVLPLSKVRV